MKMEAWINGEFKGWEEANVSILSHSFGRGSAIFEVMDIVSTPDGPAYFGLQHHIDRLMRSAELMYMDLPLQRDEIISACLETARRNRVSRGGAKLFAYYPGIEFEVMPQNPEVHLAIFCVDFDAFGMQQSDLSAPVDVGIASYKKLHPETIPIHAKVCGGYVNGFLATAEAKKNGYDDVINIDTNGYIAESAAASVFFVRDGVLHTARDEAVLRGITRMILIQLAAHLEIDVNAADILPDALKSMDEAFFAVSLKHIQPIRSINGNPLTIPCPGPLTSRLTEALSRVQTGRNEHFKEWLTYL